VLLARGRIATSKVFTGCVPGRRTPLNADLLGGGELAVGRSGPIDVHHHFVPERYAALRRSGNNRPDGIGAIPQWSEEAAIDLLDGAHIDKAFLSISSPGVLLDGCDAADLTRIVDDEAPNSLGDDRAGSADSHPFYYPMSRVRFAN